MLILCPSFLGFPPHQPHQPPPALGGGVTPSRRHRAARSPGAQRHGDSEAPQRCEAHAVAWASAGDGIVAMSRYYIYIYIPIDTIYPYLSHSDLI